MQRWLTMSRIFTTFKWMLLLSKVSKAAKTQFALVKWILYNLKLFHIAIIHYFCYQNFHSIGMKKKKAAWSSRYHGGFFLYPVQKTSNLPVVLLIFVWLIISEKLNISLFSWFDFALMNFKYCKSASSLLKDKFFSLWYGKKRYL